MKSFLKNYRQSPRKVRLVADLVRGKNVNDALLQLDFLPKRASEPMKKLLNSAIANALNNGSDLLNLFVKEIRVDKGIVMKRMMPAAMGSGHRINKRTSHISIVLGEKIVTISSSEEKASKKKVAVKKEKTEKKEKKEIKIKKTTKKVKETK
jgi:large subunit ribosomal protein L22